MISKKYIILIFLLCGIVIAVQLDQPEQQEQEQEQEQQEQEQEETEQEMDLSTKTGLLLAIKSAGEQEDYMAFAKYLKMVYERIWDTEENFTKAESEIYMQVTENYFDKGDISKALEISDIVYKEAPQGWRFRYLKIRCLEKFGRNSFKQGNLEKAEEYAMRILQIMFRPEGADLLGDIYIQKIETNLGSGDKQTALNNLNYIWDYELSQDRRDKLIELKTLILR